MSRYELKDPGFGLVNFFTLKVIFVDILIAFGDVLTDYAQVKQRERNKREKERRRKRYGYGVRS